MQEKRTKIFISLLILITLTLLFVFILRPEQATVSVPEQELIPKTVVQNTDSDSSDAAVISFEQSDRAKSDNAPVSEMAAPELDPLLRSIKEGKSSVLNLVFSSADLNAAIKDLLQFANEDEAWADFALGQIVDTCGELHQRSEPELIEMFSSINQENLPPQQQNTISQLLPIVVDASKRCRSVDEGLLAGLGNDARSWFRTASQKGDSSAFVISGFTMINERLKAESEAYQQASDEERWKVGKELREKARTEFRETMRGKIEKEGVTPELLVNISEHLNLFYSEGDNRFRQQEAWTLLACDLGYENNCSANSTAVQLKCMFHETCQSGADYRQGVLWAQGQYKLDEYQQIANELRQIFETKDLDKLGF